MSGIHISSNRASDDVQQKLASLFMEDMNLAARTCKGQPPRVMGSELDWLVSNASGLAEKTPLVYTAFDGDHQLWTPMMRRMVFEGGGVPVNPDSVLDYREVLLARPRKRDVLLADLSLLRKCDELWIFTDVDPTLKSLGDVAEGVLVELLFFLKRHRESPVYFVAVTSLAAGTPRSKVRWNHGYEESKAALPDDMRQGILSLANTDDKTDERLPVVTYVSMDPLDFKYSRFVLHWIYGQTIPLGQRGQVEGKRTPLLPLLAVCVGDQNQGLLSLGHLVICWIALMRLAGDMRSFPSIELTRQPSALQDLWKKCWLRTQAAPSPQTVKWDNFSTIPKLNQGTAWAITEREKRSYDPCA